MPLVGDALSILLAIGIYEGDYLREWLGNELAALGVETFADLAYADDGADATVPLDHRYRLVVDAVRASISVPYLYEALLLSDLRTRRVSTLVDDQRDGRPPRWPTFGVDLIGDSALRGSTIFRPRWLPRLKPVSLLESLITTLVVGHDHTRLADPCVAQL